ncbi:hypothetical protein P8452_71228 [Trifolium repens]|nr:hypothetical protein P8452_71228 [Trifolium repens]
MVKKCGSYFNINHIWYLLPEMNNLDGLREVVNDKDFMDMVSVAKDNNNEIELYFEHGMEVPTIIVPASDEDIDDEPVQNEVDMPEVEVQNDETVVDGDYDAETEVDGDSDVDTNVDGDSDAENANLDAAFNWHNDDGSEVQENIIHQNVIPSSSDEEWNSYHSEELKSPISTDDEGEGHNIKGCGNVGVPTRPKKWKSPIAETAHVGGQNEIDASSSQPTTEPATQEYVEHAPQPIAPPSTQVNVEHAPHPTVEPAAQVVDSDGTFQFGFGLATFEALPTGVRPPPIRAPPNMYRVPFPGETSSAGQGFMAFMPTPRGPN